ncbi:MAG: YeeE/YedE family protein [Pseudomonadota bacterium]
MDWLDGIFDDARAAALIGLATGVILGLAARRGRFCTLGAIEDGLYGGDWTRVRMWALALGVAILGTHGAAWAGMIDLGETLYARSAWNPVGSVVGGTLFGYGMAIAGNCGYGALARLGGGDLRSLVIVVVMGIAAYMTIAGPLAGLRVALFPPEDAGPGTITSYPALLERVISLPQAMTVVAIAMALLAWALSDTGFRRSRPHVIWGAAVGIAVVLAWLGTGLVAEQSFDAVRIEGPSFTRPAGETLLFLMTSSGSGLSFGIGSVGGVILGALIGSMSRGHFRWEACDDPGELGRQILGGALMGVGGVLALGCSIGQGLTAFSTLALSAPVVLAAIFAGTALGLRHLIRGFALST